MSGHFYTSQDKQKFPIPSPSLLKKNRRIQKKGEKRGKKRGGGGGGGGEGAKATKKNGGITNNSRHQITYRPQDKLKSKQLLSAYSPLLLPHFSCSGVAE